MHRRTKTLFPRLLAATVIVALTACGSSATPQARVESAKAQIAKRDFKAAVIELRNALQKNADMAEARYLLGVALAESGDGRTAEKELRKALELGWDRNVAIPRVARLMVEFGDHDKVIDEFANTQLTEAAANAELQAVLGDAQLASGKLDDARTAYLTSLTFAPDNPYAALGLARIRSTEGDLPGAIAMVDKVLAANGKLADAHFLKADLAMYSRQFDAAIDAYRNGLAQKPDAVMAHFRLISLLHSEKRGAEAEQQARAMQSASPNHPLTQFVQAMALYQKKDFAAARELVQQALKVQPNLLPAVLLAGLVDAELNAPAQAEKNFLFVLEHNPGNVTARRALVSLYMRSNQGRRALPHLEPLIRSAPRNGDVLALAGYVYLVNNDLNRAESTLERAAALAPEDPQRRAQLAVARFATGHQEQAFADLEAASAADTKGAEFDVLIVLQRLRRGEFDQALSAIAELEKKQPPGAMTYNMRGLAYLGKKDTAQARQQFEKAIEATPDFFPAAVQLARLDVADGKSDAAKRRFEKIIDKDPKHLKALVAVAELSARSGDAPEVVQRLYQRAIKAHPREAEPRVGLVAYHVGRGDKKAALAVAQEAAAELADNPGMLDQLGKMQLAAGEATAAVQTYTRLTILLPDSAESLVRLAGAQAAAGASEGAVQSLRKALAADPQHVEAQALLAAMESRSGRLTEALAIAKRIQTQRPRSAIGFDLAGNLYAKHKRYDEAIAAYREALSREKVSIIFVKLNEALRNAGKRGEADKAAADWLKAKPQDAYVLSYVAERELKAGDGDAAIRHYQALVALNPNDAIHLNNLAVAAARAKDPKAIEYAERAAALQPRSGAILDTLGWILVEQGDLGRGADLLRRAVDLSPAIGEIRLHYAKALIKQGRKELARKELDQLAKLGDRYPGQEEVGRLLAGL